MNMPIGLASAYDNSALRLHLAGGALATPRNETLAVLVVDDEAEVLEELTATLRRRGLHALSASSAETALAVLCSRPDIGALVSDIRMPGMDGIALAERALCGRQEADALEVVLVTGYASASQGMAASRLGAFGVLQKPMRGADLGRMVGDALARAALRRRADAPFPPCFGTWQPGPAVVDELPYAPKSPTLAAEALLLTLAQRMDQDGALSPALREVGGSLHALFGDATDPAGRGLAALIDDLTDVAALEDGSAAIDAGPVSAHALAGAVAGQLAALGARCARRITLQPDADPAFEIDTPRLLRAIALLGSTALDGAPGLAELSLDAGHGQARLDLVIRPDAPIGEQAPERRMPLALARRLVGLLGGRLDAWSLPEGGLRARLLIRA
jgi:CheY-like chemotaxis protein